MIEAVNHTSPEVLALRVYKKITSEDLEQLIPLLENQIHNHEDPHLLLTMEDFEGWENAEAFLEDLEMDRQYIGHFDRIAVVGQKKWQKWGTKLINPLSSEEIKYFPIDKVENAREWVEAKSHGE